MSVIASLLKILSIFKLRFCIKSSFNQMSTSSLFSHANGPMFTLGRRSGLLNSQPVTLSPLSFRATQKGLFLARFSDLILVVVDGVPWPQYHKTEEESKNPNADKATTLYFLIFIIYS